MGKSTKLNGKLAACLRELRMPAIGGAFEEAVRKAEANGTGHGAFLLELLEIECESRSSNRIGRLLRESQLPPGKTMEGFDRGRVSRRVALRLDSLVEGSFLKRNENVLVFGKPGSGKTHLVCAIAREQVLKGRRVWFSPCSLLVQQLLAAKRDLKLERFLRKLGKYDAIVIDDIGYVQQDREEMEVLFTLLAERYERGSVMLTSNLPFSQWERIFKDPMTTAAAIDRLVHHSVILELNVPSYRMEEAKKRKI
jgi:DNA replication protein DnaC